MPESFHFEEYRTLRAETLQNIDETRKLEVYTMAGLAAVYSWMAAQPRIHPVLCFAPMVLPLLAGLRCLTLYLRIRVTADYIHRLEERFSETAGGVPGWEHFLRTRKNLILRHSIVFWIALLAASGVVAFSIYTREGRPDPIVLTPVGEELLRLDTRDNSLWRLNERKQWEFIPPPPRPPGR